MADGYVTFDEFVDVESSLLALNVALAQLPSNPLFWKSVILNTHSALQGACVCLLTKSHGGGALTEKNEKQNLAYLNQKSDITVAEAQNQQPPKSLPYPPTMLQNLPGLLRRLPPPLTINIPKTSEEYEKSEDALAKDLFRLHEFRTGFSHFPALSWSIELAGLPRIVEKSLIQTQSIAESSQYTRVNRFRDMQVSSLILDATKALSMLR
ncbi:hypothetical protein [uncultured Litoreibacter sp.]|uniref:hypothetical protein n=1 Tax=uncultured Litoreibacter sp. TaxID=1392394 RepID=UPI002614132A|nr:hypothetical protein [uncultured Litoreibacter sp.]